MLLVKDQSPYYHTVCNNNLPKQCSKSKVKVKKKTVDNKKTENLFKIVHSEIPNDNSQNTTCIEVILDSPVVKRSKS